MWCEKRREESQHDGQAAQNSLQHPLKAKKVDVDIRWHLKILNNANVRQKVLAVIWIDHPRCVACWLLGDVIVRIIVIIVRRERRGV